MKIEKYRRARIYKRFGVLHAMKGGSPVLITESSWRTVNGFFINTERTGFLCIQLWHAAAR
jgi:hypothetical protein